MNCPCPLASLPLVLLLTFATAPAGAGEYNSVMDIGTEAPAWKDLPGTDGKSHSLDNLKNSKVLVVAFTCNSCPYAVDAESRLKKLVSKNQGRGVAVVAISVNKIEEDGMEAMKERAEQQEFNFPYLRDDSQEIAKLYGAKYTPEFFVFDETRKLVYMGSFDDSPAGKKVSKTYVQDAVNAALLNESPTVSETVPIGCRIRFERTRRSRKR